MKNSLTCLLIGFACFCSLTANISAQPFSWPLSSGGGDHDFVLSGMRYRISPKTSSISIIDEQAGVTGKLPFEPSLAEIRSYRWKNQLLLFYGQPTESKPYSGSGVLAALDAKTLNPKWHLETDDYTETLFIDGDALYLAMDKAVEKIDLVNGKRLWSQKVPYDCGWTNPRTENNRLLLDSAGLSDTYRMKSISDGVLALNSTTGEILEVRRSVYEPSLFSSWRIFFDAKSNQRSFYQPLASDYATFTLRGALARWEFGQSAPVAKGMLPLDSQETITSVCAGEHGDFLWCFYETDHDRGHLIGLEKKTLTKRWHHVLPGKRFARPGNFGTESILLVADNTVQNIHASTGTVLWTVKLPVSLDGNSELIALSTPTIYEGLLRFEESQASFVRDDEEIVPVVDSGFFVLDPLTGEILERKATAFQRAISP